jgi:hypothetical protein
MAFLYQHYYISLILQAICIIHVLKTGKSNSWIWVIFFLPVIGSIIYIVMNIYNRNKVAEVQSNVIQAINPSGTIKKLKQNLEINNSFQNKVLLADAYLRGNQLEEAREIYENSLQGPFKRDPKVCRQLVHTYHLQGEHKLVQEIVDDKLLKHPDFDRSLAHLRYAQSLEQLGLLEEAELQFDNMNDRYSLFQMRYEFALFLLRRDNYEKALDVLEAIRLESSRLKGRERREQSKWINLANAEYDKMKAKFAE